MAWVITQPKPGKPRALTSNVKEALNLGWLIRHARQVESFIVGPRSLLEDLGLGLRVYGGGHAFIANLPNKLFVTEFLDLGILEGFLMRPTWRGLPVLWYGDEIVIGKDSFATQVARKGTFE